MTKLERRTLEYYKQYRRNPPKANRIWLSSLRTHSILIGGAACLTAFDYLTGHFLWSYLMLSFIFGVLLSDYRRGIVSEAIWPLFEDIIDWDYVDELLEAPEQ